MNINSSDELTLKMSVDYVTLRPHIQNIYFLKHKAFFLAPSFQHNLKEVT